MELFPNPASNEVTIMLRGMGSGATTLTIYDQLGRKVLVERLAAGQFKNGIYMVSAVTTDGLKLTKRLMVAR